MLLFTTISFSFWLLVRSLSKSGLTLTCCAPFATVLFWLLWLQAQGWPGTFEKAWVRRIKLHSLGIAARRFVRSNLCLKPHFRPMRHYS